MSGSKIHNPIQAVGGVVAGAAAVAVLAFVSGDRAVANEANCTEGCDNGNGTPNTTTVTETNETLESNSGATAGAAATQGQSQTTYNINNPGGGGHGGKQVQNATEGTPATLQRSGVPVFLHNIEYSCGGNGHSSSLQIGTQQTRNDNFTLNVPGMFGVSAGSARESMPISNEQASDKIGSSFDGHLAILEASLNLRFLQGFSQVCGQQTPPTQPQVTTTPPVPVVPPQPNEPPVQLEGALPTEQVYAVLQGFGGRS